MSEKVGPISKFWVFIYYLFSERDQGDKVIY